MQSHEVSGSMSRAYRFVDVAQSPLVWVIGIISSRINTPSHINSRKKKMQIRIEK
jgi:hypothetical protein